MAGQEIICIVIAYLLGGICTGYYLVRLKLGLDIREQGSGGVGARNVGRVLGRPGFMVTLLGDALKGLLAVVLAYRFSISDQAVLLVLFAVVVGHIWPLPLQFRGGRGIATAFGAYLAYDYHLILLLTGITLVLMVFRRGLVLSGLMAFLLLPIAAHAFKFSGHTVAALAGVAGIILFAHRERICKALAQSLPPKEA